MISYDVHACKFIQALVLGLALFRDAGHRPHASFRRKPWTFDPKKPLFS